MRILVGDGEGFDIRVPTAIEAIDYVPILALGMLCALGGIAIMRGVTLAEDAVPPQPRAGLAAPGDRRARGRRAGADLAGGAVLRPLGAAGRRSTRPTRCRTSRC